MHVSGRDHHNPERAFMKTQTSRSLLVSAAALPLFLAVAGCNDRDASVATVSATESNRVGTADADNTAKNIRDRDNNTLTPGDQGDSTADREITQKIRKALVIDATGYSATAKNIKIITVNGKVTLRGPVKSDAEKSGIVAIAKTWAGEGNVENQLEVKANP